MGRSTYAPAEESSSQPLVSGDRSLARWRPFDAALFVSTVVLALGLGIYAFIGGDLTAGIVAVTAVPVLTWLSGWAERFLQMQHVRRLDEQRRQDRMESQLQEQQARFEQMLTIDKRATVVEKVLALLHRYGLSDEEFATGRRAEQVRAISELVYETLIYFHDDDLIEKIVDAFVACFRGQRARIVGQINEIANGFRRELLAHQSRDRSGANAKGANVFAEMTDHLHKLNKAIFGIENGIVPVRISSSRSLSLDTAVKLWNSVRFGRDVEFRVIEDLMPAAAKSGEGKTAAAIQPNDILLVWRDDKLDDNDGVVGVIWVESVNAEKQTLRLGRRVTVPFNRRVQFHRLETYEIDGKSNATIDYSSTGVGKTRDGAIRVWIGLEKLIRSDARIPNDQLDYPCGFAFGVIVERLEDRQSPLAIVNGLTINAELQNMRGENLKLIVPDSEFLADDRAERLFEELTERDHADVRVRYAGVQWEINTVKPPTISYDAENNPQRGERTTVTFRPISGGDGQGKFQGTQSVKVRVEITESDLALEILGCPDESSATA